jgi:hypothetical protein
MKKTQSYLEKEKQAKIEKRKKNRNITVNILNSSIYNLDGEIKHFLHDEGYFTGTNGIPLTFKLINEQITKSKQNIFICKIKIDICFRNEVKSYSSTGYGNDKRQAVNDAHTQWVKIFKENFNWIRIEINMLEKIMKKSFCIGVCITCRIYSYLLKGR